MRIKYEESNEDVHRRMGDIQDSEAESMADLGAFLDAELEYHDRCRDILMNVRRTWPAGYYPHPNFPNQAANALNIALPLLKSSELGPAPIQRTPSPVAVVESARSPRLRQWSNALPSAPASLETPPNPMKNPAPTAYRHRITVTIVSPRNPPFLAPTHAPCRATTIRRVRSVWDGPIQTRGAHHRCRRSVL